jgi:mannose-6-phosphate isomerase
MDRLIVVFLKWPAPGLVKTRLGTSLGDERAAAIYRQLITAVATELIHYEDADIAICFTPAERESDLRDWLAPVFQRPIQHWWPQVAGDLGGRQHDAIQRATLLGYTSTAIIGTDCLGLTPAVFNATWQHLTRNDWVLGPTEDGGYYLVGVRNAANRPGTWKEIRWSTEHTRQDLLLNIGQECHSYCLLENMNDVDDYEDWISIRDRLTMPDMTGIALDQPIVFSPIYMQRVWGGRSLETHYQRSLPEGGMPFGESWEIVDREGEEQSIVQNGELRGKSLHDLWTQHRTEIFGSRFEDHTSSRFPVLVKILDAQDRLSIQVHPPADIALSLNGEPKTEMWYIAHAEPNTKLYVGLKEGIDHDAFKAGIAEDKTEAQVHAISPKQGQFIFIPSGRLHAIGAGLVIYEIQQNSDTTYRVFDWNRVGLDGMPRDLHIEESLKCIDFEDVEPGMDSPQGERLVTCDYFAIDEWTLQSDESRPATDAEDCAIVTVVEGNVVSGDQTFKAGDFFLVPANATDKVRTLTASGESPCKVLITTLP